MFTFIFTLIVAAATVLPSGTPSDDLCVQNETDICALVAETADGLTAYLEKTDISNEYFQTKIESASAEHRILHIFSRSSRSSGDFEAFLTSSTFQTKNRFELEYSRFNVNSACQPPLREIVEAGGKVKVTLLYKDGGVAHEGVTIRCPP